MEESEEEFEKEMLDIDKLVARLIILTPIIRYGQDNSINRKLNTWLNREESSMNKSHVKEYSEDVKNIDKLDTKKPYEQFVTIMFEKSDQTQREKLKTHLEANKELRQVLEKHTKPLMNTLIAWKYINFDNALKGINKYITRREERGKSKIGLPRARLIQGLLANDDLPPLSKLAVVYALLTNTGPKSPHKLIDALRTNLKITLGDLKQMIENELPDIPESGKKTLFSKRYPKLQRHDKTTIKDLIKIMNSNPENTDEALETLNALNPDAVDSTSRMTLEGK